MLWAGHVASVGERKCVYVVLVGKPEGKRPLGSPGVDGRIILRLIFRMWFEGMLWIEMAQDRDRWRAFVNAVMNLLLL
jgi:transposase